MVIHLAQYYNKSMINDEHFLTEMNIVASCLFYRDLKIDKDVEWMFISQVQPTNYKGTDVRMYGCTDVRMFTVSR